MYDIATNSQQHNRRPSVFADRTPTMSTAPLTKTALFRATLTLTMFPANNLNNNLNKKTPNESVSFR